MFVDEENDIVNISPFEGDDGGEVISINGVKIQLPQQPSDKHILFSNLPKEEQYWRREELPDFIKNIEGWDQYKKLPDEVQRKYDPYIKREWHRRKNGVWFYNNGKAIYLTGANYMFLQWAEYDFGYPDFMLPQWKWHIHAEACDIDHRCVGQVVGKSRRWGWTSMVTNFITVKTTQVRRKNAGIISKTEDDAREVVFEKVKDIFNSWPFFYRPIHHFKGKALKMSAVQQRITVNNQVTRKVDSLGSQILYGATKNKMFDGWKFRYLALDEMGKLEKPADFHKLWEVHRLCLYDRIRLIGKAFIGTTVEDMTEDGGGTKFKEVYMRSDPNARQSNGRTKSGLYKFFVSSYEVLVLDKYGNPVIENPKEPTYDINGDRILRGSKAEMAPDIKSRENDLAALNDYLRKFPIVESDMFRVIGGNSLNTDRIYLQLQYNEQLSYSPTRRGVFEWTGERFNSPVRFVPDKTGQWTIAMLLKEEHENAHHTKSGMWVPANTWLGVGGADPFRTDRPAYGKGSNASCHIVTRVNMSYPSNAFIARYNGRPEMLTIASEQMLMGHIYFGVQCLIEREVELMINHWIDWGFEHYLMLSPPRLTSKGASRRKKNYGLNTSGDNVRSALVEALQRYVNSYVGRDENGEVMENIYFNETLNDWAEFDIHNATKHDDSMSSGLALIALTSHELKETPKVSVEKQLVRIFDNSGRISRQVQLPRR